MRSKLVAAGALVAGITLGAAGSALGGGLAPVTVDPTSGTPGTTFAVSGEGCISSITSTDGVEAAGNGTPTVVVTVNFPTPLVEQTTADADGNWSVTFTVPEGTTPGTYSITADCQNEPQVDSTGDVSAAELYPEGATFTVLQEDVPVNGPVVPEPGAATPAPAVAGAPRFTG